ncbi:hypothetical protein LTR86_004344 [Recurvomyces mirabilis]|nr:hypothetical protein LTR86_004344 [Recurvomyces mirabilis]
MNATIVQGDVPVGWKLMQRPWPGLVLAVVACVGLFLGSGYAIFTASKWMLAKLRQRRPPTFVTEKFRNLRPLRAPQLVNQPIEPSSFGIFLGGIDTPPTPRQAQLLTQWDLTVLDPRREGVQEAVASASPPGPGKQIVARLDAATSFPKLELTEPAKALDTLFQTVDAHLRCHAESATPFTGVLLANYHHIVQPAIINELVKLLVGLNVDVYLEVSPPDYLTAEQCSGIDVAPLRGIICRNATVRVDGERCDYYQMVGLQRVQRALAKHTSLGGHTLLAWDTLDDEAPLIHAVIKRSFSWCRFNTIPIWIGRQSALLHSEEVFAGTIAEEPIGALMWLQGQERVALQGAWRANERISPLPSTDPALYDCLETEIPDLRSRLTLLSPANGRQDRDSDVVSSLQPMPLPCEGKSHPLDASEQGVTFEAFGCFQLGQDCSQQDFDDILDSQVHLKELGLLSRFKLADIESMRGRLERMVDNHTSIGSSSAYSEPLAELLELVSNATTDENSSLRMYEGLHSGFCKGLNRQFWAVYSKDIVTETMDLFVSRNAKDRLSTVLHAFLSSRGVSRSVCLEAEVDLASADDSLNKSFGLPPGLVHNLNQLSPSETMLLLRRLANQAAQEPTNDKLINDHLISSGSTSHSDTWNYPTTLSSRISAYCEHQLLTVPTLVQLRAQNAELYLRGQYQPADVVRSRLAWYVDQGCACLEYGAALSVFQEIEQRLPHVLMKMDSSSDFLDHLQTVLQQGIVASGKIDASADFLALAVFSAFRKLALEEVYVEILDRNPFLGQHSDQAASFAEMFATGAQCETYFDLRPQVLGRILSEKFRSHCATHPPPRPNESDSEQPTSYASKLVDEDPDAARLDPPVWYRISFLSIFAAPALIDILLLSTLGRGLYLSTFMSKTESSMATAALMFSLLTCGAFGTWIGTGGSYYFFAMAYPAMNLYVLTRLVACAALCLGVGGMAFIIIGILDGFYGAWIFFFYYVILTSYLTLLATLALYQVPGFSFQSGRTVIVAWVPILFVPPLLTLWLGHDIIVYPCVLTILVVGLVVGTRNVMGQWATWYFNMSFATDGEVVDFYKQLSGPKDEVPSYVTDLATTPAPRKALAEAVWKERHRPWWRKSTSSALVKRLAEGSDATSFLMDWYTKYSRTKMPYTFSPTWNLQCKTAVDTLQDLQKGLRMHNAFIHWRFAGNETWCGAFYFVIALMDKWGRLLGGGSLSGGFLGYDIAQNAQHRFAVGFSLAYYLTAAICLDIVALPLWSTANHGTDQPISSLDNLQHAVDNAASTRRRLYWSSFVKFFFLHIWGVCVFATLMWVFATSGNGPVLFLAYTFAYTGLLWYQYNRIFAGSNVLIDLLITAPLGLSIGIGLQVWNGDWPYGGVIALAATAWCANLLSFRTAKIGWPSHRTAIDAVNTPSYKLLVHSATSSEQDDAHEMASKAFETYSLLPEDKRCRVLPSEGPGSEVVSLLTRSSSIRPSALLNDAFPNRQQLFHQIATRWHHGEILLDAVSGAAVFNGSSDLAQHTRSMTSYRGDELHIIVFVDSVKANGCWEDNDGQMIKIVAEALVHASAEAMFGMSHHDSMLVELLLAHNDTHEGIPLAQGVKRLVEISVDVRTDAIERRDHNLLSDLLFGLECDHNWQDLPADIRSWLVQRCCGRSNTLTAAQVKWARAKFNLTSAQEAVQCVLRWSLSIGLQNAVAEYARAVDQQRNATMNIYPSRGTLASMLDHDQQASSTAIKVGTGVLRKLQHAITIVRMAIKLFVISLVADPELQRELDFVTARQNAAIKRSARLLYSSVWLYCGAVQHAVIPWFLFHGRPKLDRLNSDMKGIKTVVGKRKVIIEGLSGISTCFIKPAESGSWKLYQYTGHHDTQPPHDDLKNLAAINIYGAHLVLKTREQYFSGSLARTFTYEYATSDPLRHKRLPLTRHCIQGDLEQQFVVYDEKGYTKSGSYFKDNNLIAFKYFYRKDARYEDELLRAEFNLAHIRMRVSWCFPPPEQAHKMDHWIPHSKVTDATFINERGVYRSTWSYHQKWYPIISTTLNGEEVDTPDMIKFDWFDILKKPHNVTFASDDPLLKFTTLKTNILSRSLRLNIVRYPVSTASARSHLWKTWASNRQYDAATIRWLDYMSLRSDSVLKPYWRHRDRGRLTAARKYLDQHADAILAQTDMDPEVSSKSSIAYKFGDLYSFGQGGDSRVTAHNPSLQFIDTHNTLHVTAMDTGTWPIEGGGVSACRRDMVNGLDSIRWHVIAEAANDFGTPKFQIERNVESLSILPLWGLDFLTPSHGVFEDSLDSAVQQRWNHTSVKDIEENFLPILYSLVKCARAVNFEQRHVTEATEALIRLNAYFEKSRHWGQVWLSATVKKRWRELWLAEDIENTYPVSKWLDAELPSLDHLDGALDRWHRYLFIFSVPIPEKVPDVFQASHHFAGASYGILWKMLRGSSLHIWDHGISWREVTVTLSSAMSWDAPFVSSSLLSLSRMTSILTLYHADILLPCADFFNPDWETEHGTQGGTLQHRRLFARKIDPIVNGITGMEQFEPVKKIKTDRPTVVMLSHVRFIKDIKNAILAADIIVNDWGIKDYQLDIYGDLEKTPSYSAECKEILASKGLRDNVALRGLGKPSKVLENAWLFLNSSVSEGLPLAMGEAALTGVPIVCTDVGASFRVVTDPVTWKKFSAVVAPNDSHALAQAQIEVLALLGEWAEYADDKPGDLAEPLPKLGMDRPSARDVERITKRMYEKTEQRRALGMIGRKNVLESFSSERYLREHEQMLWIGKLRNPKNAPPSRSQRSSLSGGKEGEWAFSGLGSGGLNDSTHSVASRLLTQG